MSSEKKSQTHQLIPQNEGETLHLNGEITYLPCKFCGSKDYDIADGDVDDDGNYEPDGCDCCAFKLTALTSNSAMWH